MITTAPRHGDRGPAAAGLRLLLAAALLFARPMPCDAAEWTPLGCPGATTMRPCTIANPGRSDMAVALFFQHEPCVPSPCTLQRTSPPVCRQWPLAAADWRVLKGRSVGCTVAR